MEQALDSLFNGFKQFVEFETHIGFQKLINFPFVTGFGYIKYKLTNYNGHSIVGRTQIAPVEQNCISWTDEIFQTVKFPISDAGHLLSCKVELTFKYMSEARAQSKALGVVNIDLAEFAGDRNITVRFLLMDSKINSTLQIFMSLYQVSGDIIYKRPKNNISKVTSSLDTLSNSTATQMEANKKYHSREELLHIQNKLIMLSSKNEEKSLVEVVDEILYD